MGPIPADSVTFTEEILFFFLFINKHIYNRHITKIKKGKTKIHITVITCKATVRPEIKTKKGATTKLMNNTWANLF